MRTVSQLSKLTGINRRTIQYFATEKLPGKSSEGAGIITPCYVNENGYRYFDDDALFELLAIKTLKQCGYEPEDIRNVLHDGDLEPTSAANLQIKALERTKREIDQQIQFVNLLKVVLTIDYEDDEEAFVAIISLFLKLFIASVEQVARRYDPDFVFDMDDEDMIKTMRESGDASKVELFEKSMGMMMHVGKGEMDLAKELIPAEMRQALADENEATEDVVATCVSTLAELYKTGESPNSKESRRQAALLFQETCPKRTLGNLNALRRFARELMEGTYMAILAELLVEEGFADYFAKTFESYYAAAKKRVEMKRAEEKSAEDQDKPQERQSQAATA